MEVLITLLVIIIFALIFIGLEKRRFNETKWTYTYFLGKRRDEDYNHLLKLGKEGWELVVTDLDDSDYVRYILKRPLGRSHNYNVY